MRVMSTKVLLAKGRVYYYNSPDLLISEVFSIITASPHPNGTPRSPL